MTWSYDADMGELVHIGPSTEQRFRIRDVGSLKGLEQAVEQARVHLDDQV